MAKRPTTDTSELLTLTRAELAAQIAAAVANVKAGFPEWMDALLSGATGGNPFDILFPPDRAVFRTNIAETADTWRDGTTAHKIANVILGILQIEGAYITTATLKHLSHPSKGQEFRILLPSSGGSSFRQTLIDTRENPQARDWLYDWNKRVTDKYLIQREQEAANGAAPITVGGVMGVSVDADRFAKLGIGTPRLRVKEAKTA
jgi:hypothetical protein